MGTPEMSDYGSPPPPPPPPYGAMPAGQPSAGGPPPPNYLVWAILATIFCCLPLGIPAIVFASQVNSKWQTGDFSGAQEASRKAKQFSLWSTIAGVVVGVLYALLIVAGAVGSNT